MMRLLLLITAPCALALPNGVGLTPAMGWSSWNAFAANVNAAAIMQIADVLVSSGLAAAGYKYVNIDCGWALSTRNATGFLQPNPVTFPGGIRPVMDYLHARGLMGGLYTEHFTADCCGGPGAYGHATQDAQLMANEWQIDYLKIDSCAGHDRNASEQFADYAAIAAAFNSSGRSVYLDICPTIPAPAGPLPCQAWDNVYAPWPAWGASWADISNSALVEFCNNANSFTVVESIVDAQAALSNASQSGPGHWLHMDMLTVGCDDAPAPGTPCAGDMTQTQNIAQFSLWCVLASPLILGSDLRNVSAATLAVVSNASESFPT